MSTTAANIISELDLNSSFSELTEAQKLAALNSALQAVSELYNDAGKDAFVRSTLEGASVPVASLKNPARAAYVDSNFTGLSAPFFTSEASAIAYLQALSPVPSTTNPALMRSFLAPANQSTLNLSTLLAGGIRVERIDDNLPRFFTGTALPTFSASKHPKGTRFRVIPASGAEIEYTSNGARWCAINGEKIILGIISDSNEILISGLYNSTKIVPATTVEIVTGVATIEFDSSELGTAVVQGLLDDFDAKPLMYNDGGNINKSGYYTVTVSNSAIIVSFYDDSFVLTTPQTFSRFLLEITWY